MLHDLVHRLDTIEHTLKAIEHTLLALEHRMMNMDANTQRLSDAMNRHIAVVNDAITDIADLSAQLATANSAGDKQAIADIATQLDATSDKLQAAVHPVAAAATAAGVQVDPNATASTDTTAAPPAGSSPA